MAMPLRVRRGNPPGGNREEEEFAPAAARRGSPPGGDEKEEGFAPAAARRGSTLGGDEAEEGLSPPLRDGVVRRAVMRRRKAGGGW